MSIRRRTARAQDRTLLGHVMAIAVLAALTALLPLGYVNYDQAYALVWGSEILDGGLPSYEAPSTPTPHPLATALGVLASSLGSGPAERLLDVLSIAAFAVATWTIVLIGRELAGWGAGAVAGLAFGSSVVVLLRTMSAVADLYAVAFVVVAVLVEMRRSRAGVPVLVLLGLAGLQRPEAWVLAGAYWLWLLSGLDTRGRIKMGLLAIAAPTLWVLGDLLVTGNPLFSFVATRDAPIPGEPGIPGGDVAHDTPLGQVSGSLAVVGDILRNILRLPVLVGAVVGAGIAVAIGARRTAPAMGALVAWLGVVVGFGIVGLPIDDRFLFPVSALLTAFFGVAAAGWLGAPRWRGRTIAWTGVGLLLLASLTASIPDRIRSIDRAADRLRARAGAVDGLRELLESPTAQRTLQACGVTYTPNYRLVPFAAFSGDLTLSDIRIISPTMPRRGTFIAAATPEVSRQFLEVGQGRTLRPLAAPRDATVRASNASWRLLARGC